MNKKDRTKAYFDFLKKRTALAKKKIDLSNYQPKPKKVFSAEAIKIVDTINDGDFGCQTESVYDLVKALTKVDLPSLEEDSDDNSFHLDSKQLQTVPWACYSTTEEDEDTAVDCYFAFNKQEITHLSSSIDTHDAGGGPWYINLEGATFTQIDFATDAQIKLLLKDEESFKAIDSILGFLTEK